ncbi:phage baseplate protein [Tuberibacillus sp. Marseille-P3662]|uniref:phage baseplate protein n=1 Tax=Tuberibacillus sp. Marseille-P3662 TaxID=1965358 RepID=UPI00111C4C1F|nr:hypothetical protein [Tuberibacillus sp. Marseille-P3662]
MASQQVFNWHAHEVNIKRSTGKREPIIDYTTIQPIYFTILDLYGPTVLQCMVIDETTGYIYATQVDNHLGSGDIESFRIVRLNQNGEIIDWMACKYGGHGTTFGIENVNGKVYIWSNYSDVNGNSKLVRFPYQPGTTVDGSEMAEYNKFNDLYTTPAIDQKNDTIALRVTNKHDTQSVELRRLQDVKNGVDEVLAKLDIPEEYTQTMQGMTIDGYDLYWYTGDSNKDGIADPWRIIRFDMRTGKIKGIVECDFGREPDGSWLDGFREPESVYLYTNPKNGQKTLFGGVVVGAKLNRTAKIYVYQQPENTFKKAH